MAECPSSQTLTVLRYDSENKKHRDKAASRTVYVYMCTVLPMTNITLTL